MTTESRPAPEPVLPLTVAEARHELDCVLDLFRLDLDRDDREAALTEALDDFERAALGPPEQQVERLLEAALYAHAALVEVEQQRAVPFHIEHAREALANAFTWAGEGKDRHLVLMPAEPAVVDDDVTVCLECGGTGVRNRP